MRVVSLALLLIVALAASAQQPATAVPEGGTPSFIRAETPQERQARLGTAEDPGTNPDPKKHFWRFGKSYRIEKFERRFAAYDQPMGFVRPFAQVNAIAEIYQQNEKYVWVWSPDPVVADQPDPAAQSVQAERYNDATYEFLTRVRPQFTPLTPEASGKTIRFVESSAGLPATGSWRNGADVADMNGDRCKDIVAPPQRQGNGLPAIFLGDCKGGWKQWQAASFPFRIDYGSVVARDFNKDGKTDLAFAVHLNGLFVFLGNGKGKFTDSSNGLPHNFPTRRLIATDVDRDGDADLVALSEGPTAIEGIGGSGLRVFLNNKRGSSWSEVAAASEEARLGGDWVSVANFNGDAYPDFITASVFYGTMDVLYLGTAPVKWKAYASDGDVIPSLSYYFANAAGKFTSKTRDDIIVTYSRFWPPDVNPQRLAPPKLSQVVNVDRLSFNEGRVTRSSIARWTGTGVRGVATADFDRDGNLDFAYVADEPRALVVMLGDGKGNFASATVEGLTMSANPIYDLIITDFNNDGVSDVLVMFETASKSVLNANGLVQVFLGVK